jgi:hypothetical protein
MRSSLRALPLAVLGALLAVACRDPTQIVLQVHTDVPCSAGNPWQGVAVYLGSPGHSLEEAQPTLVSTTCDEQGSVGSLVVVPSGAKDDEVGLRVVAGLERTPEDCAAHDYDGCIVARRSLRFTPHDSLEIDLDLRRDCVSIGCDEEHTCFLGRCVESETEELPRLAPESTPDLTHSVQCGLDGLRCPTEGNVCCLTVAADEQSSTGACRPPQDCLSPSIVLNCDDDTDCAAMDSEYGPGVCGLSYLTGNNGVWLPSSVSLSSCRMQKAQSDSDHAGLALCQTRQECAGGKFICRASGGAPVNPLPGYYWCETTYE